MEVCVCVCVYVDWDKRREYINAGLGLGLYLLVQLEQFQSKNQNMLRATDLHSSKDREGVGRLFQHEICNLNAKLQADLVVVPRLNVDVKSPACRPLPKMCHGTWFTLLENDKKYHIANVAKSQLEPCMNVCASVCQCVCVCLEHVYLHI